MLSRSPSEFRASSSMASCETAYRHSRCMRAAQSAGSCSHSMISCRLRRRWALQRP